MHLLKLPKELLLQIASYLDDMADISRFLRSHRRFYDILVDYLYQYDAVIRHKTTDEKHPNDNSDGASRALRWAAFYGDTALASKAIGAGASVNAETHQSESTEIKLHYGRRLTVVAVAVAPDHINMVRFLRQHGAHVNRNDYDYCEQIIFLAIANRSLAMVKLLTAVRGLDLGSLNKDWLGVLEAAAQHNSLPIVEHLLSLLDVPDREYEFSTDGALAIACDKGYLDIARRLLSSKHVDGRDGKHATREVCREVDHSFWIACCRGHLDIVKLLWKDGEFKLSKCSVWQRSPMEGAMVNGHEHIVEFLLQAKPVMIRHHLKLVSDFARDKQNRIIMEASFEYLLSVSITEEELNGMMKTKNWKILARRMEKISGRSR